MAKSDDRKFIYWFSELGIKDVPAVGGKNASLGEMFANLTRKGVQVPNGYAVSAYAYDHYITSSGIRGQIEALLKGLDPKNIAQLAERGDKIRTLIRGTPLPKALEAEIMSAYDKLSQDYGGEVDTAVRSSATAEDLPDASFAGQQDTYLNIRGHKALLEACRACFASLFTDRAIAYREEKKFSHFAVALSIAVQKMVRSDLASAGVMFTIDTESGFKDAVYVTAGYGLGESVVGGLINPDEFYVHKPTLQQGYKSIIYAHLGEKQRKMIYTDPATSGGKRTTSLEVPPEERRRFCLTPEDVLTLARWGVIIEEHYSQEAGYYKPMDMEWAKDGQSGQLFIVQARPETVISRRETGVIRRHVLDKMGPVLAEGMAVGDLIGNGPAHVIKTAEHIGQFKSGAVLVTEMTDPDWVPIMKIASAIVTDMGGRTCHAAIISRELGIPCIVGTGNASKRIAMGQEITVSCAGGSKGVVYQGLLPHHAEEIRLDQLDMPKRPLLLQQSDPDRAFPDAQYPHAGVGLIRIDELMRDEAKVHPLACLAFAGWKAAGDNAELVQQIEALTAGYDDKAQYFVESLARGIGRIAAASFPRPARVLLSDGTSRDLDQLVGGREFSFSADERNPALGARGAARYGDLDYEEAFGLELKALKMVRDEMGLGNVSLVLPSAQTAKEARVVTDKLGEAGLQRGKGGLELHLLVRTPAQALALAEFAEGFDGFVFDVGGLAQLAQGMDGSNLRVRDFYSETHPAVLTLLELGLKEAKKLKKPAGLANIAPGTLAFYAGQGLTKRADYVVARPEVLPKWREALLEAEGRKG
ncbi:MAG: phosphoenolpyruvate synthase [Candidatus Lambdaproteobacteria bacterium]|nr:phosphoenolpyruvate synthase [Candidatus Lambdaproteobacteria bacterium]